ncbi:MAG: hypothetical protein JWM24_208 [Solirubrobacterales bacterium]|nr:hypothetical protein [Solirubrobacterales bacterium]
MEPRYKSLVVSLVPQSREIPPPAFAAEDLQRIFADVTRSYPYQAFEFLFGGRGAQFTAGPEDSVELRPALLQVRAQMDGMDVLTAPMAEEKALRILKIASERLEIERFVQCQIAIVALVEAPGPEPDAKAFVAEKMMHDGDQAAELGPGYVGAGVQFKSSPSDGVGEEMLSVEPFFQSNDLVFLSHQITRVPANEPPFSLDQTSAWIAGAFDFLSGPTMRLLNR